LPVQLTAAPGVPLAGRDTAAWGFDGTSPGPTLRVRPGDVLRIRLVNQLDQATNLHTHGMHVSPQGNGDNPFVSIEPGTSFDYEIRVPADHPAGTFWYHPHHHGTVADQIFAGLAGALLVDGGPALAPRERVLLVTDTTLDTDGRVAPVDVISTMMGRQGALVLVNGQHQPVITAASGIVERWRVINGCTSRGSPQLEHPLAGCSVQAHQTNAINCAPNSCSRHQLGGGREARLPGSQR
jgi:FtsP/CotA-like multicopper oxidase with cupredoxin domain